MNIDLSYVGSQQPIDVRGVECLSLQVWDGIGDSTGAVVEAEQSFDFTTNAPRAPIVGVSTLDLTGSSTLDIDVTNMAWVHIVVTTAVSGVSINVDMKTSGSVFGQVVELDTDLDFVGARGLIDVEQFTRCYLMVDPVSPVTTGAIEIKKAIGNATPVSAVPSAVPTIDGSTITEIQTENASILSIDCTTAQTGQMVRVWAYIRQEASIDMSAGQSDFFLNVAKGLIPGHSLIHKYGSVPNVDTNDDWVAVWGGAKGPYLGFNATAAEIATVVSNNVNDASGGTGARTVTVSGLDADWLDQTETVTMNGTTPVDTVGSYIRLFRAYVEESGSGETNEGEITIAQKVTTAVVFGTIEPEYGQSNICAYTIPANKTAYLYSWDASINGNANASLEVRSRRRKFGKSFRITEERTLLGAGTSYERRDYKLPKNSTPPKTDLIIEVNSDSNNNAASASFDLLLVEI